LTDSLPLPLDGVRIIAVDQYGAGPFATAHLGDLGAEIIKIEPPRTDRDPGGDSGRHTGPHFLGPNESHFFQTFNGGKKSLTLDLRAPEGQAILHRLVEGADAVVNNLRGDQPAKLGLDYASLSPIRRSIVCGHISGYGRTGSRSTWPAYDYLAQAEAGFLSVTGEPDGPPTRFGLSIVDFMTGATLALGLTASLLAAARTGIGRDVDVTLFDVALHLLNYPGTWYLNEGHAIDRRPRSGHPVIVPCEAFPTADGQVFVMCILPKFWRALCEGFGRDDLVKDRRFATPQARFDNRDALVAILDPLFRAGSTAEMMARFAGKVPIAPVLALDAALDNPYLRETDAIAHVPHRLRPDLRVVANPIRLDGQRLQARAAPALGGDTDAVLATLGYGEADIAALRAKGIV
jgi:crotonobetainyl-CoA:carnitine CoA-transferase CaiB-like acyl-CoA transferase